MNLNEQMKSINLTCLYCNYNFNTVLTCSYQKINNHIYGMTRCPLCGELIRVDCEI